jgi:hypothetical protein
VGAGGEGKEWEGSNWKLASSKGPARMGICHHYQGTAFPSKGFSFLFILEHVLCVPLQHVFVCA